MKKTRRLTITAVVLLTALAGAPWIVDHVIEPASRIGYILLRMFLLHLDQWVIWEMFIAVVAVVFGFRVLKPEKRRPAEKEAIVDNTHLARLTTWQWYFERAPDNDWALRFVQREFIDILVRAYAGRKHISPDYQVTEAFTDRRIPLPEQVYSFLFAVEPDTTCGRFRRWLQRLTGRDRLEIRRNMEATLHYLEKFMELKNDHD